MNARFADTGYFVATSNALDALHGKAIDLMRSFTGRIVTTEYVLVETANFFCRQSTRFVVPILLHAIRTDRNAEVVPASGELFDRGVALFAARPDKDWSLTDCISFTVMADRGLTEALTADRHFEQAGFLPLLA